MLILQLLYLLIGLFLLWGGAELLVKGSSSIAIGFGVRPLVVGLTIVAMGTSSPELAVSLFAALANTKDLSLANIIGSNIANIGLVVGISAMIKKLTFEKSLFRSEIPILVFSTLLFSFMSWDGLISMLDGIVLLICFVLFLVYMVKRSLNDRSAAKSSADFVDIKNNPKKMLKQGLFILSGLVGLVAGSFLIVESAEFIARFFGVSTFIIGVSVVAVGTSLPELAISAVGAARGRADLAIGNAIGSNLFNTLFVLAVVAVITPIPVDRSLFKLHYPFMIGFTLLVVPLMWTKFRLTRTEGAMLFAAYVAFLFFLFI
jgi:cation:H+ antiporter